MLLDTLSRLPNLVNNYTLDLDDHVDYITMDEISCVNPDLLNFSNKKQTQLHEEINKD